MDILLTGGSACGKSSLGEDILQAMNGPHIYIATMIPYGEDGEAKVRRHRNLRHGKGFTTVEKYVTIHKADIPAGSSVLLECICNLTANEMFENDGAGASAYDAVIKGIEQIKNKADNLIVITNEVGNDGGDYDEAVFSYIQTMGKINNRLAATFPCVYEMCCGIPVKIKGDLSWAL